MTVYWVTLFAAIATSMVAQTFLKAGAGAASFITQLFDWRTLLGFVLYGGGAVLAIVALRRIPMSRALPHGDLLRGGRARSDTTRSRSRWASATSAPSH